MPDLPTEPLTEPSPPPDQSQAGDAPAPPLPVTIIEKSSGWKALDLRELWRYRELLFFLAWRDVKVRYKQTVLGVLWAVLQPMLMMVVFSVFLGQIARIPAGDLPYPIFVYAGLLPWMFFATAIANSANSVVDSERIITKVYFPRLAIPFGAALAALVDFCIAACFLVLLMIYYGVPPAWSWLLIPPLALLVLFAALGVGTFLAALNVKYRDFRYVIPFMVQLWMFATPSIYMQTQQSPWEMDPEHTSVPIMVHYVLQANPLTGVIAFFRAAALNTPLPWQALAYSGAAIAALFLLGCFYFRRVEDSFADII